MGYIVQPIESKGDLMNAVDLIYIIYECYTHVNGIILNAGTRKL